MEISLYVKIIFSAVFVFYFFYTIVRRSKIDLFSPTYIFPLAYILYLSIGSSDLLPHDYEITEKQWVFYLIGILFFCLGSFIPHLHMKTLKIKPKFQNITWDKKKLLQITFIIFIIAITARSLNYLNTGIPLFGANINIARQLAAQSGYLGMLGISTEIVFIISFAAFVMFKKNRKLFLCFMIISFVLSIFTGSRQSLVRMIFPCIVFFHYYKKRIPLRTFLIVFLIILLFVGSMKFLRVYKRVGPGLISYLEKEEYKPYLYWAPYFLRDFQIAPEGLARVLELFPEKENYKYGELHISPFLMPLPGEQLPPDMIFKKMVGGQWEGFGMASTLLAPQYADFGITGIMIGMFLIGFMLVHLYLKAVKSKNLLYILLYAVILVQMLVAIRSNYVNFVIIWTVFLLIIIHSFVKKANSKDTIKEDSLISAK